MSNGDYGMCCSKEMANRCARQYEELAAMERHKERTAGILTSVIIVIALLFLLSICN